MSSLIEAIEFDKAVGLGMEFAKTHPDTLIVVTGDHTHGVSIIGTVDDEKPGDAMRDLAGVIIHRNQGEQEHAQQPHHQFEKNLPGHGCTSKR